MKWLLTSGLILSSIFAYAPANAAVIYELGGSQSTIIFKLETPNYVLKNNVLRSASTLTSCTSIFGTCTSFWFENRNFEGTLYDQITFISRSPRGASITSTFVFASGAFSNVGTYQNIFLPNASLKVSNTNIITAVPEPASWALMLLGFAAVGGAMRKKARFPTMHSLG